MLTPTVQHRASRTAFKANSQILAQFEDFDFSHIEQTEIPQSFPNDHTYMQVQHVPLIPAICQQIASAYIVPPRRTWLGLGDVQAEALAAEYRRIGAARMFLRMHRAAVAQHTVVGILFPRGDGFGVQLLRPYQLEVDPDPLDNESVTSAAEVRAMWPVKATHETTHFGVLHMNRERIFVRTGSGDLPVWGNDTRNPFPGGDYPAFTMRLQPAKQGDFFAELPLDKLDAQIATTIAFTDAIYTASKASWGLDVFKGMTKEQAQEMRGGPGVVVGLRDNESFEHVPRGSNAKDYLSMVLDYLSTLASVAQISPDKLTGWQRAITAVAKQVDYADRSELRAAQRHELERAEGGFANALLRVLRWRGDANQYPEAVAVEMEYREPQWPADLLHYGQERALAYASGRGSPVRDAMEHGMTEAEAIEHVRQNLQWNRDLGIVPGPNAPGAVDPAA